VPGQGDLPRRFLATILPPGRSMPSSSFEPAHECRDRLEPHRHDDLHSELDAWRANVGSPVALDAAPAAAPQLRGIDVLCWNVAIGLGRLDALLDVLRSGTYGPIAQADDRPLIILLQEVFRSDETVPGSNESLHHGGRLVARARADIVDVAMTFGLSLRYSPSMRNGAHASDRGNAVLSSVRLTGAEAFLLPYVRQRRVAVAARIDGHPELAFVSAHLDTHGRPRRGESALSVGAGRAVQARALGTTLTRLAPSVVLGADLNSLFGMTDPAVRELVQAGMHPARRIGEWRHTFHRPLRLLLDHVLYRCSERRIAHAEVLRIDEQPGDRSRTVFGSDHHPLLARIELS
jgi:endonuclease/exonuclease/phosphatase family metal-dependent hydrolase